MKTSSQLSSIRNKHRRTSYTLPQSHSPLYLRKWPICPWSQCLSFPWTSLYLYNTTYAHILKQQSVVLHGVKRSRWCHPDDVILCFFSLLSGLDSNCEIIHVDTESAGSFNLHGCVGLHCMSRTLFVTSLLVGREGFFPVCLYYRQYCILTCCSYFIMHLCEDLLRAYA